MNNIGAHALKHSDYLNMKNILNKYIIRNYLQTMIKLILVSKPVRSNGVI